MNKVKIVLSLIVITMIFGINSVYALSFDKDVVTTNSDFTMSTKDYEKLSKMYDATIIDNTKPEELKSLISEKTVLVKSETKYIITDYTLDIYGNVVLSIDREVSKSEAEKTKTQNNAKGNTGLPIHQTASKVIVLDTYLTETDYLTTLSVDWFTTPAIKSYDVIALMWVSYGNIGLKTAYGIQRYGYNDVINYSYNGTNMVKASDGVGISMNLVDEGSDYSLILYMRSQSMNGSFYGTYQHATRNVTLAQSKSYSFNSSGLGGVLLYNNSTIAGYYDNMQGVALHIA